MRGTGEEPALIKQKAARSTSSQPDSEHDDPYECDITGEDPSSVVEVAPHVVDPGERPRLTMKLPGLFDATQREPVPAVAPRLQTGRDVDTLFPAAAGAKRFRDGDSRPR
jgi:hypothetical protein